MLRSTARKGFTLIELLIVVVIIGILAAIAIPKFANTKEKAYLAAMKSDLKNLATAEESYFADNQQYLSGSASNPGTGAATPLMSGGNPNREIFIPSAGVTVTITAQAAAAGTPAGWSATATHTATNKTCAMFINVAPVAPATVDGEPKCTT